MSMKDGVKIDIIIDNSSISELHDTVSSILMQNASSRLNICVNVINQTNLPIESELSRLKEAGISISPAQASPRFTISLTSGEALSKSFLYKAVYYLKHNDVPFVCPEYTFKRIDNSLIIATVRNHNLLSNIVLGKLVDLKKESSFKHYSPQANIIPNTCIATTTIDINFKDYYRLLKKEQCFFDDRFFSPHNVDKNSSNQSPARLYQKKNRLSKLCGNSKVSKAILKSADEYLSSKRISKDCPPAYISPQIKNELSLLSTIKLSLNGYENMKYFDITSVKSKYSQELYYCYQLVTKHLLHDKYDYIMVVPWIIPGGIDLFSINYLKTIAELHPDYQILAILTNDFYHSLTTKELNFPKNIELINLPDILHNDLLYQKYSINLLYSLINVLNPQYLHIIASKVGYDCIIKYSSQIHAKTSVLFSSYNYIVGKNGEYLGYHVQELPRAYRPGDIITTDNQKAKDFLAEEYGFIKDDILIHRQLLEPNTKTTQKAETDRIKILWAAHVRPEKNPEILPKIAKSLSSEKIDIVCYGLFDPSNWENGKNPLKTSLKNLTYAGPYQNFFKDIEPSKYDLFLYTSLTDGTPNVILEAAIAGLPIVSSDIGGIRDVVGQNAILIKDTSSPEDFINGIKQILSHKADYQKKSLALKTKLAKLYDKNNFDNQVKDMLKRSAKNV